MRPPVPLCRADILPSLLYNSGMWLQAAVPSERGGGVGFLRAAV